jgi:hypothetical protein
MGVTNCQGQVTGLEIWDDFDHAGGSLEAAFSFPGTIVELNEAQDLDHLHELDVRFAREDAAYSSTCGSFRPFAYC